MLMTLKPTTITLGSVYNHLGFSEHLNITRNFLCCEEIPVLDINIW